MRVLHVTNLYPFEDSPTFGIFVKEQIDSLTAKNLQDVFFINARKYGSFEYIRAIRDLRLIIGKYDVIHCHHQFSAITTYLASPRAKIVTAILGDIEKRNKLNKILFSIANRVSDTVIFKNKIPSGSNKYVLLPNGVNLDFFKELNKEDCRMKLGLDRSKSYVLFVCNGPLDNPIKRHDKYLEVLERLNERYETKYVPLYLNNVGREMVPFYYNAADFLLMTSDHEGSPNAVKEAMASNLPVVSTAVGDVPVLLKNVKNSFVAREGDIEELLNLCSCVNHKIRSTGRTKLQELGLDSVSVAEKLKKIYLNL